jgi:hypothetical protein
VNKAGFVYCLEIARSLHYIHVLGTDQRLGHGIEANGSTRPLGMHASRKSLTVGPKTSDHVDLALTRKSESSLHKDDKADKTFDDQSDLRQQP